MLIFYFYSVVVVLVPVSVNKLLGKRPKLLGLYNVLQNSFEELKKTKGAVGALKKKSGLFPLLIRTKKLFI